jgi:quercetin dioxygenase-like cupin family protein
MITRRTLVGSAGLLFAGILQAQNSGGEKGGSKVVMKHDLPELSTKDWALTAVEVTYGPGESSAAHRHPGITVAYVLEGEIRSKVGDGPEQTYTAGQMFFENPGELHGVSGNASKSKPAKLLALLFAEKGKPLTTPA